MKSTILLLTFLSGVGHGIAQTHSYPPGSGDWFDAAKLSSGDISNAANASVSLPNHDNASYTVTLGPFHDAIIRSGAVNTSRYGDNRSGHQL